VVQEHDPQMACAHDKMSPEQRQRQHKPPKCSLSLQQRR
jgi:hypothetical protein